MNTQRTLQPAQAGMITQTGPRRTRPQESAERLSKSTVSGLDNKAKTPYETKIYPASIKPAGFFLFVYTKSANIIISKIPL